MMRIKNWENLQHKNGGKTYPWIKLYRSLLEDMEFYNLDGAAAKLLVYLWLLASEKDGVLPDIDYISFRLRIPKDEIELGLLKLEHWVLICDSEENTESTHSVPTEYPTHSDTGTLDRDRDREGDRDIHPNGCTAEPDAALDEVEPQQGTLKGTGKGDWRAKASETHLFEAFNSYPAEAWRGNPKDCQAAWDRAAKMEGGYDVLLTKVLAHLEWWDRSKVPRFVKYLEEGWYNAERSSGGKARSKVSTQRAEGSIF